MKIVLIVSTCCLLIFLFVSLSGQIPASFRSKERLVLSELTVIGGAVSTYYEMHEILPLKLQDLAGESSLVDEFALLDPFSGYEKEYGYSRQDSRITIWSVGPDGEDSIAESCDLSERQDELVLILKLADGSIESEILQ